MLQLSKKTKTAKVIVFKKKRRKGYKKTQGNKTFSKSQSTVYYNNNNNNITLWSHPIIEGVSAKTVTLIEWEILSTLVLYKKLDYFGRSLLLIKVTYMYVVLALTPSFNNHPDVSTTNMYLNIILRDGPIIPLEGGVGKICQDKQFFSSSLSLQTFFHNHLSAFYFIFYISCLQNNLFCLFAFCKQFFSKNFPPVLQKNNGPSLKCFVCAILRSQTRYNCTTDKQRRRQPTTTVFV